MKKPSLAEAMSKAKFPVRTNRAAAGGNGAMAPSRAGKKALMGYFDPAVSKQLKQIANEKDSSIQALLGEALNDLFRKLKKPAIA